MIRADKESAVALVEPVGVGVIVRGGRSSGGLNGWALPMWEMIRRVDVGAVVCTESRKESGR
jgi:hypothetical protein